MMKDLIQVKRILQDVLHVAIGRVHLVVNNRIASYRIGRREIETVVGLTVESEFRFDGHRPEEAALQGEILALSDPSDPLAKAAAGLARTLTDRS